MHGVNHGLKQLDENLIEICFGVSIKWHPITCMVVIETYPIRDLAQGVPTPLT